MTLRMQAEKSFKGIIKIRLTHVRALFLSKDFFPTDWIKVSLTFTSDKVLYKVSLAKI